MRLSFPTNAADPVRSIARRRFLRALTLMAMTLVLPGSAQIAAGNPRVGRIAMRIAAGLVVSVVAMLALGMISRGFVLWLLSNPFLLGLIRFGLIALAIGWAGLFFDAWRIGNPLSLRQKQRLFVVGFNGLLCFTVAGSLLFVSHLVSVQRDFIALMFGSGPATAADAGRYNVLLLGGDSGSTRWGLRADSINVASIDEDTGQTVIFGLPRNMLNFPFAEGSVMHEQFPDGFDCGPECELNSLSTWAADHKALFQGIDNPGVEATRSAVEGITGLNIHYYAMVDLHGFKKMVDAVGGLTLNVRDRIPIGGVGGPVTGYIKPGVRKLNGFETLWFARSRESADDYSRMARQKCVMSAMLDQLSPATVILRFEELADASRALLETDLPASEVGKFADLALSARGKPIKSVSFVPPVINTSRPDIDKIRTMVADALQPKQKQQKEQVATAAEPAPKPAHTGTTGGAIGSMKTGYAANQADDLESVC